MEHVNSEVVLAANRLNQNDTFKQDSMISDKEFEGYGYD